MKQKSNIIFFVTHRCAMFKRKNMESFINFSAIKKKQDKFLTIKIHLFDFRILMNYE